MAIFRVDGIVADADHITAEHLRHRLLDSIRRYGMWAPELNVTEIQGSASEPVAVEGPWS